MPKEQGPLSLEQLKAKEVKLQDSLFKADRIELTYTSRMYIPHLKEAIEKSPEKARSRYTDQLLQPQHIPMEANLRVADIKKAITNSATPKIVTSLVETQKRIREQDEASKHISRYASYLDELKGAETYVKVTQDRIQAGHLSDKALKEVQAYYSKIESLPQTDPELAHAREVYLASLEPQKNQDQTTITHPVEVQPHKEQEGLPSIKVDRNANTVQLDDGETIKLTRPQMAVFAKLASSSEPLRASKLRGVLKNVGVSRNTGIRQVIREIRAKIEVDPNDPKILTMEDSRSNAKYSVNATSIEIAVESERSRLSKEAWKTFEIKMPDGQIVKIQGQKTADALKLFINTTIDNQVGIENIANQLYGKTDAESRSRTGAIVRFTRKTLKPHGWTIIQSVPKEEMLYKKGVKKAEQKQARAKYYLEKIKPEDGKDEGALSPTPPTEAPSATSVAELGLRKNHLKTLGYIKENPDGDMQKAIGLMGPTRKSIPHTRPQAAFASKRALWHLFNRNQLGTATEDEQKLKAEIEEAVGLKEKEAQAKFKEIINNFFSSDRKKVVDVIETKPFKEPLKELPTEAEVALLVTLYKHRRDIIRKFELPELPEELIEEVLRGFPERLSLTSEQIIQMRNTAYDKFANIVQSDQLNELYEQAPESAKKLIIYFMDIDPETQIEALRDALLTPTERHWQSQASQVIKYWQKLNGHVVKQVETERIPRLPEAPQEQEIQDTSDLQELKTALQEVERNQLPAESTKEKHPKKSKIEQRIPDIRIKVTALVDVVLERSTTQSMNSAQMQRVYNMSTKYIKQAEERGYVSPRHIKDSKPIYDIADIATLVFLKNQGNGLTPREIKDVHRLIHQEVKTRPEKQNDSI